MPLMRGRSLSKGIYIINKYLLKPPVLSLLIADKSICHYRRAIVWIAICLREWTWQRSSTLLLKFNSYCCKVKLLAYWKLCLAFNILLRKLGHYMLAHVVYVIKRVDPCKYIMSRIALFFHLAKWTLLFS